LRRTPRFHRLWVSPQESVKSDISQKDDGGKTLI
jgi:hypothetical protein